jgi:hypothetical protein
MFVTLYYSMVIFSGDKVCFIPNNVVPLKASESDLYSFVVVVFHRSQDIQKHAFFSLN